MNLPSPKKNPVEVTSFPNIEPLTDTEPVNSEPICEPVFAVVTTNVSPLATDAVAEPLAINGAAAACTLVINLPSPKKNPLAVKSSAISEPLTLTEPVNCEPI